MALVQQNKQKVRLYMILGNLILTSICTLPMRTSFRREYKSGAGMAKKPLSLTYARRTYKLMFIRHYGRTKLWCSVEVVLPDEAGFRLEHRAACSEESPESCAELRGED